MTDKVEINMVEATAVPLLEGADNAESDFQILCKPCLMYSAVFGILIVIALLIAFLL